MKKKINLILLTLIIIAAAGSSMAWQIQKTDKSINEIDMGTVKVEVLESGPKNISKVKENTYSKSIKAKNLGTEKTYVRARLVAEWNEPSLPVSNVEFNLSGNGDWTKRQADGYYYFKYYLEENQITSVLLDGITFKELDTDYEGAEFALKTVIEGVQTNPEAWKDVWGISTLPFIEEKAWTP